MVGTGRRVTGRYWGPWLENRLEPGEAVQRDLQDTERPGLGPELCVFVLFRPHSRVIP